MKIAYRIFLSQFNSVKNCFLQKLLSKSIDDPDPRVSTHGWRATVRWRAAARPRAVMQCSQARVGNGADTPSAQLHCACCNTAPVAACSARTLHMWAAKPNHDGRARYSNAGRSPAVLSRARGHGTATRMAMRANIFRRFWPDPIFLVFMNFDLCFLNFWKIAKFRNWV